MFFDRPKTVFLISPQPWHGIKVSKHHYAMELAALGHHVFFIDPPKNDGSVSGVAVTATDVTNVTNVRYRPFFPYGLKFKARWLFDRLMRIQARRIATRIGQRPNVVWDFDNAKQFVDLRAFGASFAIHHLVDEVAGQQGTDKHADLVLCLAQEFADSIVDHRKPIRLVAHALNRHFAERARMALDTPDPPRPDNTRFTAGYVGNLDHPSVDWPTILSIVDAHPDAAFVFVGPYDAGSATSPVAGLKQRQNVTLTGLLSPQEILSLGTSVDAWLMLYHGSEKLGGVLNSHKLLEYLATGKPILSTRVRAFEGSDLVMMGPDHTNTSALELFSRLVAAHRDGGDDGARRRRLEFAAGNSYATRLQEIDAIIRDEAPDQTP